jgi:hypothetical protein
MALFLVNTIAEEAVRAPITVVVDWAAELKKSMALATGLTEAY